MRASDFPRDVQTHAAAGHPFFHGLTTIEPVENVFLFPFRDARASIPNSNGYGVRLGLRGDV